MTITRPTTWGEAYGSTIREGLAVSQDGDELRDLNRAITRAWTHNVRLHAAVLSVHSAGLGAATIPGIISAGYTEIGRGYVRIWDQKARFRLHIYGLRVSVRCTIGGQSFTVNRTSTSLGWGNFSALLTTAAIAADGRATIVIEAQELSATAELYHVIVEETENTSGLGVNLPDETDTRTLIVALDDAAFDANAIDHPVDAWMLQQLDDNVQDAAYWRSRGVCHLYPRTRPHQLSSVHWRLDGPYCVSAPAWAEELTVVVSCQGSEAGAGQLFALSEHERFQDVMDRAQTIDASHESNVFTVALRPGAAESTQLVWIAFRTAIGSVAASGSAIPAAQMVIRRAHLYCADIPDAWAPYPYDKCIVSAADEGTLNVGAKGVLTFNQPSAYCDLGCMKGENNAVAGSSSALEQIIISPHPATGLVDTSQLGQVLDDTATQIYNSTVDFHDLASIELTGVLLEAAPVAPARRRLARPGMSPASGLVQQTIRMANQLTQAGTPQITVRHTGQRNRFGGDTGNASHSVFHEGHWLFVWGSQSSPQILDVEAPIVSDPNYGAGSGLVASRLYGQAIYLVVSVETQQSDLQGRIQFYFRLGASSYTADTERVEEVVPIQVGGGGSSIDSPTLGDALSASVAIATEPGPPTPTEQTEHAFTQQYTWPPEGYSQRLPWRRSGIFSAPLGGSYPALWRVACRNDGCVSAASNSTQLIVAGYHVWIGPRA